VIAIKRAVDLTGVRELILEYASGVGVDDAEGREALGSLGFQDIEPYRWISCHPERERGAWADGRRAELAPRADHLPGPSLTLGVTTVECAR
jgi:hypothetical protein